MVSQVMHCINQTNQLHSMRLLTLFHVVMALPTFYNNARLLRVFGIQALATFQVVVENLF